MKKIAIVFLIAIFPSLSLAQSAYPQPQLGMETGLYRLYNPKTNNHLYTVDYHEAFDLNGSGLYILEGTVGHVFLTPAAPGYLALHRFYNPKLNKHAFVIGENGLTALKRAGYKEEAIIGHLPNSLGFIYGSSTSRLYLLNNAKTKDTLLTRNAEEAAIAKMNGYAEPAFSNYFIH